MRAGRKLLVGVLLAAAAATQPAASAELVRSQRTVAGIEYVQWQAIGELHIVQGPSESLTIEAEERLHPLITAEVRDRTLILGFRSGQVSTSMPIRFVLKVRHLKAIDSRSSGTFRVNRLQTPALQLRLAGSGDTTIGELSARRLDVLILGASNVAIAAGNVEEQTVQIAGSGDYDAGGLDSVTSSVAIPGSGNATVSTASHLSVRITGAGEVRYFGNPRLTQSIEGAGEVRRIARR